MESFKTMKSLEGASLDNSAVEKEAFVCEMTFWNKNFCIKQNLKNSESYFFFLCWMICFSVLSWIEPSSFIGCMGTIID